MRTKVTWQIMSMMMKERTFFVRPNMVIAVSLPYSMLRPRSDEEVLDMADKDLVTGEVSERFHPSNRLYKGVCQGTQEERDNAYHQGTVWPWLYGPFCEGWLKVYGKQGVQRVRNLIYGLEEVMSEHGITTISEIYDGDPPHSPQGAISQAWSVGEVLRILDLLDNQYHNFNRSIMRVLMFGWEFPPHISGGLGTASYGLTKGMATLDDLDVILWFRKHGAMRISR
jgi:glycogen debranching enzyme